MSVRQNTIVTDIWKCVHALLKKYCDNTAPWSSWDCIKGYPEEERFADFTKPFIYTEDPFPVGDVYMQQGASKGKRLYSIIIGAWDDRKTGGIEEITIMTSRISDLFSDPYTVHTATFDVTLATAISDTTLKAQGIRVDAIGGPRKIEIENQKEFRREFELRVTA